MAFKYKDEAKRKAEEPADEKLKDKLGRRKISSSLQTCFVRHWCRADPRYLAHCDCSKLRPTI